VIAPAMIKLPYGRADGIVFPSRSATLGFRESFPALSESRLQVIRSPVDLDIMIDAQEERIDYEDWVSASHQVRRVIAVGVLTEAKVYVYLMDVMRIVVENMRAVKPLVLGDGEDRARLKRYALEIGVLDHIEFPGIQG